MKNDVLLQTAQAAAAEQKRRREQAVITDVPMYCENCGGYTLHKLYHRGDWEIYSCACGTDKRYRVR